MATRSLKDLDTGGDDLVDRLLQGNRRVAGRLISAIENGNPATEPILRRLYLRTGKAYVVGFTGPPGAGKSTLVDEFICVVRGDRLTVGVIAVDPNSPFSGGAILGDRIRMGRHAVDPGVYIRSMGARGHLGGLARSSADCIKVLDAMGRDLIVLETVGVGQSELEITGTADTTVVVIPPGQGDGVQAIKAGIMEIADVFVVNKADQPQAGKTIAEIRDVLRMELAPRAWTPPIVQTIATEGTGLEDLWMRVQQHRRYLEKSGEFDRRRRARLQRHIVDIAAGKIRLQVLEPRITDASFDSILEDVLNRKMDPYEAAETILPVPPQPEKEHPC